MFGATFEIRLQTTTTKKQGRKKTEEISILAQNCVRKFMRFGEFSQDQCKLFQRITTTTTTKTVKFEAVKLHNTNHDQNDSIMRSANKFIVSAGQINK